MSVTDEITRLQTAKADLKTAIEGKGVTVSSSTKLDGYADLIDSISSGGSSSSSDEWLYYNVDNILTTQSGMDTSLVCSNSSNLVVERIVSEGSSSYHWNKWWADYQISDEPMPTYGGASVNAYFRIKPNSNMNVGDTGTFSYSVPSGTTTITFKLIETFSEEQMYHEGVDIQKLTITNIAFSGGGAND